MADLPNVEAILERQAKSWELRKRLEGEGEESAREALLHLKEGPWITISRQWGSRGVELTRAVGRELGWEIYDREILIAIAENTQTREAVFKRLDQGAIGPFRDYVSQLIVPGEPGQMAYVQEMTQVVWGLARQGQAVIVGRGANWFLDSTCGLRVRVVDAFERRVAWVADRRKLSEADARKWTLEQDNQRRDFIRKFFGRDIDDPLGYDLVINLQDLGVESAAKLVLDALRSKLQ